ncbi:5-formyltetrahydrofolate cyclo-ligase [Halalkalibacter alkaliphilus]|uniref:5-formyltetrahydrofolate cyclo-ligase n=1 Tax=Halalkalibacter alkaliphilus TaxID=2917993 RepID=A0A9X2CS31_9BACI|nr:5-formyltetrahydrofolate cyclo-ligase [Halalkalibacter alkaliphilus]MCL7747191.1 5-formyltetrahydrofolate cyclo-ligase [Halalkalibacter alkaliphilus]
MLTKKDIRNEMSRKLDSISAEKWKNWSKEIADHLVSSSLWKESGVIALTVSRGKEVDTYCLIETAWKQGKKVVVPRADFKQKRMSFFEITSFNQLEEGPYNLKEPNVESCPSIDPQKIELVIVPGLAFDKNGSRLGFGGGFYDRFLPKIKAQTIALALPCQVIPFVPTEPHDCLIDHIISPAGFLS